MTGVEALVTILLVVVGCITAVLLLHGWDP